MAKRLLAVLFPPFQESRTADVIQIDGTPWDALNSRQDPIARRLNDRLPTNRSHDSLNSSARSRASDGRPERARCKNPTW